MADALHSAFSSASPEAPTTPVTAAAAASAAASDVANATGLTGLSAHKKGDKGLSKAPIEEFLMGMNAQQMQQLSNEVEDQNGKIYQAIQWVRSHPNEGYTWCANEGQVCQCDGWARYGTHAGGWPKFSAGVQTSGSVYCNAQTFGQPIQGEAL